VTKPATCWLTGGAIDYLRVACRNHHCPDVKRKL
jgi:hypothetical protein